MEVLDIMFMIVIIQFKIMYIVNFMNHRKIEDMKKNNRYKINNEI